ncbi:MAG: glycine--tRNA ligase subunit beta, partial [Chloroflexota bacterium]
TQFTYFQQAGGMTLDPVSVEITYGLERILMAVQGVGHFSEIRWDGRRTYGDLLLTAEQQHSKYFFETADVELLQQMYSNFEAEARSSLAAGLVFPAYDYLLKCSHTFNVLDARGAIGVTERASYFGKMREIARGVARAYLAEREGLGFPWSKPEAKKATRRAAADRAPARPACPELGRGERSRGARPACPELGRGERSRGARPASFLLELGTEELPVGDLNVALKQLEAKVGPLLAELRLGHAGIEVMGTPRRLVVHVRDLARRQTDRARTVKGPPAVRAYDDRGKPTEAARGFAKSAGLPVTALQTRDLDGGKYVVAEIREAGRPSTEVLAESLPDLLASLQFEQPMRWNGNGATFSRPIRWMLALHGGSLISFEYAGLQSGRTTRRSRTSDPEQIRVKTPGDYFEQLRGVGILLDGERRRAAIGRQIDRLAAQVNGRVAEDPDLLQEVTDLVEAPAALRGKFDRSHLDLPREVLVSVMKVHQRYFPVEARGKLLPYFIAVGNGTTGSQRNVIQGNEQVIRARFADAAYFIARDLSQPLEAYLPRLGSLTFQAELGSMLDKTRRVEQLVGALAKYFELSTAEREIAVQAGRLCKADLATQMVTDMTSLQGSMGRYYALRSGESREVAEAIYEHYLPRTSGDALPKTQPGVALALADRLDTLMGLFAVGIQPSGTRDPYAMRRTAIGLVQILIGQRRSFDLRQALQWALEGTGRNVEAGPLEACLDFIVARQQPLLLGEGWPHDAIASVLAEQGHDPYGAYRAVEALSKWVKRDDWPRTLQAHARCVRITREQKDVPEFMPARIDEGATRELYQALLGAEAAERQPGSVDAFMKVFRPMISAIDRFFEEVLVMTDQRELRENRLALLMRVRKLADGVADFSKLEGF